MTCVAPFAKHISTGGKSHNSTLFRQAYWPTLCSWFCKVRKLHTQCIGMACDSPSSVSSHDVLGSCLRYEHLLPVSVGELAVEDRWVDAETDHFDDRAGDVPMVVEGGVDIVTVAVTRHTLEGEPLACGTGWREIATSGRRGHWRWSIGGNYNPFNNRSPSWIRNREPCCVCLQWRRRDIVWLLMAADEEEYHEADDSDQQCQRAHTARREAYTDPHRVMCTPSANTQ